jgi:hypothetical protein
MNAYTHIPTSTVYFVDFHLESDGKQYARGMRDGGLPSGDTYADIPTEAEMMEVFKDTFVLVKPQFDYYVSEGIFVPVPAPSLPTVLSDALIAIKTAIGWPT